MANTIRFKRGSTIGNAGTPASGEPLFDTSNGKLYVGDGSTSASSLTAISDDKLALTGGTITSNLLTLTHGSSDTRLKIEASASNRAGILQLLGGSSDKVAIDFGQSGGTGDLGRIRYDIGSTTMNFINGDHSTPELILGTSSATFAGAVQVNDNNLTAKMTTAGAGIRSIVDRVDTSDYAGFEVRTNGSQRWFVGAREDSTDNLQFYNGNSSGTVQNVLTLNHSDSSATFAGNIITSSSSIRLTGWATKNISWGSADSGHGSSNTGARIEGVVHASGGAAHGALNFYTNSGDSQKLSVSLAESGAVSFNGAYTFPTSIGSAGQVLKVPSSGTTLEWGTGGGSGSPGGSSGQVQLNSSGSFAGDSDFTFSGDRAFITKLTVGSSSQTPQNVAFWDSHVYMSAGYAITWANGNASIAETGYALQFNTYDNSTNSKAFQLNGDNTATHYGDVTITDYESKLTLTKTRNTTQSFHLAHENDDGVLDFLRGSTRTARITNNSRWVIGGHAEVNGSQLSVQGTLGTTDSVNVGGSIGVGGTPLTSTGVIDVQNNTAVYRLWNASAANFVGGLGTHAWAHSGNNTDLSLYAQSELYITANASARMRINSSYVKSYMNLYVDKTTPYIEFGNGGNTTNSAIRLGGSNSAGGRLFFQYNGDSSYIDCYGGHGSTERYRDLSMSARSFLFRTASGTSLGTGLAIDSSQNVSVNNITVDAHTFTSSSSANLKIKGNNSAAIGINLYADGNNRGWIYSNDSSQIGFLNTSGQWDLRKTMNGDLTLVVSGSDRTAIHSGNIGSQSVDNADKLDSYHGSNYIGKNGNSYYRPTTWIDFRDANNGGDGLYWGSGTGSGWHIYPGSQGTMYMRSGSTSYCEVRLNTSGTDRGMLYANSSNEVGFLDENGSWALKKKSGGSLILYDDGGQTDLGSGDEWGRLMFEGYGNGTYIYSSSTFRVDGAHWSVYDDNELTLGEHDKRWQNIYAYNFQPAGDTYGTYSVTIGGSSWAGIRYSTHSSRPTIMFKDNHGDGGLYHQGASAWRWYYDQNNGCIGLNGSTTNSSYGAYITGSVYTTGSYGSSDIRFKENIETIENGLDKVMKMRGVYFDWINEHKEEKGKSRQVGVIAQEINEVLPEVVMHQDNDEYAVDYSKITGVLIEAIKDLKNEINELKKGCCDGS